MDAPAVVIEMAQSERENPFAREMIAACNASVRGTCVLVDVENARALAVVTWVGDAHREVRIEVGLRPKGRWLTRELELRESDPMSERWRAVGLVIATLVGEEERAAATPPPPPPTPPPTPTAPPPPAKKRPLGWVDLTAWLSPALDSGSVFVGGALRGAWYPARAPVFIAAIASYGTTPVNGAGVRVDSLAGALGLGVAYDRTHVRLDALLAFRVERIGASVDDATGASDATQTALVSGMLSVDFVWRPIEHFGVVVGGDAFVRSQRTILELRDAPVGRILPFGGAAHLGARADF